MPDEKYRRAERAVTRLANASWLVLHTAKGERRAALDELHDALEELVLMLAETEKEPTDG